MDIELSPEKNPGILRIDPSRYSLYMLGQLALTGKEITLLGL